MTSEITLTVPRTRAEFATAVRRLHSEYLKASYQEAVPRDSRNECEQGLEAAVVMAELVAAIDQLTPINDIRIGDKAAEGMRAAQVLTRSRLWDEQAAKAVEGFQSMLVRRMRSLEESWGRIGAALGMSGQGVSKKAAEKGWSGVLDFGP
jgi:hypothetical protein